MLSRSSLLAGAAFAMLFTVGAHAEAAADGAKDAPAKKHHRAARHVEKVVQDNSAAVESEMAAMREQLEALKAAQQQQNVQNQAQMDQMRAQLAQAQATAQAAQEQLNTQIQTIPGVVDKAVAAAAPKTDKIYYRGITITPGGYAAIESVYRNHNEGADIGSSFSGIPLPFTSSGASRTAEYRESARQSRFSLLAEGDVNRDVHLTAYGEMDFLGAALTANSNESNSYQPRIRNLYTTIDWMEGTGTLHFLGGQSWSLVTMTNVGMTPRTEDAPLTIEAQYVPGFIWARQPQIRLSFDADQHFWFGVSAESPATTFYASGKYLPGISLINTATGGSQFNSANSYSFNRLPDFVAKAAVDEDLDGHKLHAEVFGIYRDFYARVDDSGAYGNESTSGGGFGGGFIVGVVPGLLDLQASGAWGKGIGRYGSSQLPDVTVGPDGMLHPVDEWAALFGATLHVTKQLDIYAYAGEEREQAMPLNSVSPAVFSGIGNIAYADGGCDTEGSSTCVGNTHYIEQVTAGFWHRPYISSWGKFQWGVQYSYTERAGFTGQGATAGTFLTPVTHENMVFTSFRFYPF